MPGSGRSYIIAGAGIAGLTLALGLAKFGAAVSVLERSPAIQEFGAGLQISPNARHVLNQLGLDKSVAGVSLEPSALDAFPQGASNPVVSMELGAIMRQRFGTPYAVMHRADLADLLHHACRRFANIDIALGVTRWDVASDEGGVTVTFDQADNQSRTLRADAFIGADGVHSQTRRTLLGGPAARFGNRIAWRTLVPLDSVGEAIAPDRVSVFFGSGFHLVCYPLPHRGQANLALFMPDPSAQPVHQPRPTGGGPRVDAILAAAGSTWTPWPLYTVSTYPWHRGNIGLIGDAAHAMVPFQAQGAAMGIEDAAVMAPLLVQSDQPAEAFSRYEAVRRPRVSRVAQLSAENGRIFHLRGPLALGRNLVMAMQGPQAHLRRLDWIYRHKAGSDEPV